MITIGKSYISQKDESTYINSDIKTGDMSYTLWFSADSPDQSLLCAGRADAFVTAVLAYAMRTDNNIICEEPLSERLYFQLTEYLIPMLSGKNEKYKKIKIDAPIISKPYHTRKAYGILQPRNTVSGITVACSDDSGKSGFQSSAVINIGTNCTNVPGYSEYEALFLSEVSCILALQGTLSECVIPVDHSLRISDMSLSDSSFIIFSINCISTETLSVRLTPPGSAVREKSSAIHIGSPYIEEQTDGICLCSKISQNGNEKVFYFKVNKEYGKYLTSDRSDAFLAALITTAMRQGKDIICDSPVTESILYRLNNYLIPLISANTRVYKRITVRASAISDLTENAGAVGTGCTCGADSMLTIMEHCGERSKCFRLTHLLCVSNGSIEGEDPHDTLKKMSDKMQNGIGRETGLPVISIDSNLSESLTEKFIEIHSFRHTSAALALQKLFRAVLWSSGHIASEFRLYSSNDGYFEPAVYSSFSTGSTALYSSGSAYTRMEKLRLLSEYPPAYRFLHPCIYALRDNDNKCDKCVRTMLGLYCLGTLDRFGQVFDIAGFERNKEWYLKRIAEISSNNDAKEVIKALDKQGIKPPKQKFSLTKKLIKIMGDLLKIPVKFSDYYKKHRRNMK